MSTSTSSSWPFGGRICLVLVCGILASAGCSSGAQPPTAVSTSDSSATTGSDSSAAASEQATLHVAQRLVTALNAGDRSAAESTFATTARFDSDGRIFRGREEIFDRFLGPDVIDLGARYTARGTRIDGDRTVVEYNFTTRAGSREHFTYAYRVENEQIVDVIGRTI